MTAPDDGAVHRLDHLRPDQYLIVNGRVRPWIRGGAEGDPPAPPTPPAPPVIEPPVPTPPAPPAPPAADLAGLQAALDQAQRTGQTAALQPLLDAAGVPDAAGLQAFITAARDAQQAQLTEAERREQAAQQREAAAEAREQAAAARERRTAIRTALLEAGVARDNLDDAEPLVRVDGDVTDETAAAAVETLKAKAAFASLFGTPATPPVVPSGVPAGKPPVTPPAGTTAFDAGRERARKHAAAHQGATKDDLLAEFAPKPSPFAQTA